MFFSYYDHIYHIKLVIDFFKWEKVTLMGHSMGAITAIFVASLYPDRIERLISIDVVKNVSAPAEYLPSRMKSVFDHFQEICMKIDNPPNCYSYEEARQVFLKGYGGSINEQDADILLLRGLVKKSENEYYFSRDPRSLIRPYLFTDFTTGQLKVIAKSISCPMMIVKASHPVKFAESDELYKEFCEIYKDASPDFRYVYLQGTHHIHLNNPAAVAPHVCEFLNALKSKM